jgi:predicted outer membrane repeat protein
LKNIIFSGGYSDRGGAVYTSKNLIIINCTFKENQATGVNDEYGGGAIYGDDVRLSIYDCTFTDNRAYNGGAVCAMGENSNDCEIFNCTFISNVAETSGGAFYSGADDRMGEIINSTFIDNLARFGDAVYIWAYVGTIDRCAFINNTANSMIYAPYAMLTLSNSIIVNNYGDSLVEAENPIIDYNWWGTTADDDDSPVVNGDTLTNYYVLDMEVDDDSADTTSTVKGIEVPADKAFSTNVPAKSKSSTFSIKLDEDATGDFIVNVDNGKIVKKASLINGSASITVDNLAEGSHQITVSYSGDGKYAPITQNSTLTIKGADKPIVKKSTKIVAKKKTFKAKKKVKKYTITLKSGKTPIKKVKVTIKVKGKTYGATTNKKGKATFKIKNLKKKGKYTTTIKFAGNKNYKATSKKVKINVKK